MCQPIVPLDIYDMISGKDRVCQGKYEATKTADGTYWAPTDMTPMQAAIAGVRLGYRRDDKICDK